MKAGLFAVAAAMVVGASAGNTRHPHVHGAFHSVVARAQNGTAPAETNGTCTPGCYTVYETVYGSATYIPIAPTVTVVATPVTTAAPKTSSAVVVVATPVTPVPTPYETICPTPGVYTIPATTITVTSAITVTVLTTTYTYTEGCYTRPEVITTVTEVDYVVVCPYTTSAPAVVVATAAATTPAALPTKTATPVKTPGTLGNSGPQWGITYTPYDSHGDCKEAPEVFSDIASAKAKGFTTVRLYSASHLDCNGLTNVGAACAASGMDLILGIFIDKSGIPGAASQVTDLIAFKHWEVVILVVIGNECIFNNYASAGGLATFIQECRSTFASVGYTGPITTTEPLSTLQANSGVLCGAVDVVGCNIHPFFNSDTSASGAGAFVAGQLAIVNGLCLGKQGINLETGWPSAGTCNGKACPSPENQRIAVESIASACGGQSIMFSYIDDKWKNAGDFGCEQSWGLSHLW